MRAVLISINPKWCEKIANGEKTIEVRKSRPKLETPFKVYIYCTRPYTASSDDRFYIYPNDKPRNVAGCVIGEFVCDKIDEYKYRLTTYEGTPDKGKYISKEELVKTCLSIGEINDYLNGKNGCFWYISDLKIYDKPKYKSDFRKPCPYTDDTHCLENKCEHYSDYNGNCYYRVEKSPQSWCYVEVSE